MSQRLTNRHEQDAKEMFFGWLCKKSEKHASEAKARLDFARFMARLKSCPFKQIICGGVLSVAMSLALASRAQDAAQISPTAAAEASVTTAAPAARPVVLDRVVAVVNNRAILASDLDDEMRLAVLDPGEGGLGILTPQRALEQLIARTLIQQQIRQEDTESAEAPQAEVNARLDDIRKDLPICARQNCATEEGWKKFLTAHGLTADLVERALRRRIQILSFIEVRFRQGIRIDPQQIENYYKETLRPQYRTGETIPPLEQVSPRIEEILLQQQVNVLFDDWLKNLRKQGDVEVLDPALESPSAAAAAVPTAGGKGGI
jgi:hypothetical protein